MNAVKDFKVLLSQNTDLVHDDMVIESVESPASSGSMIQDNRSPSLRNVSQPDDITMHNISGPRIPGMIPNNQLLPEDVNMEDVQRAEIPDLSDPGVLPQTMHLSNETQLSDAQVGQPESHSALPLRPSWLNSPSQNMVLPHGMVLPPRPAWTPRVSACVPRCVELPQNRDEPVVKDPQKAQLPIAHALSQSVPLPNGGDGQSSFQRWLAANVAAPLSPAPPRQTQQPKTLHVHGFNENAIQSSRSPTPEGQAIPEDIARYPMVFWEGFNAHRPLSLCKLCTRILNSITKHHLYPKVRKGSLSRRAPSGVSSNRPTDLEQTIPLCRPCHSMIHIIIPNQLMSDSYYTLDLLKSHSRVQAWVAWVRRQPLPSLISSTRPGTGKAKLHKFKRAAKESLSVKQRSRLPVSPRLGIPRRSAQLAGLGPERRQGRAYLKVEAQKENERGMAITQTRRKPSKKARFAALEMRQASYQEKLQMVAGILANIWAENGDNFPKSLRPEKYKGALLQSELRKRLGQSVKIKWMKIVLTSTPIYRSWYEWTFAPVAVETKDEERGAGAYARRRRNSSSVDENEDEVRDVGVGQYGTGTGIGSRSDPVVLDDSIDDILASPGGVTVDQRCSAKVVIDLTMDSDDDVEGCIEVQPGSQAQQGSGEPQHGDEGHGSQPVFFFDFGGGNSRLDH